MMGDPQTHWAELFSKWGTKLPGLTEEESEEFQTVLKAGKLSKALAVVKKSDELLKNTKLNIGVTGVTGSGKSSFVNALRSLEVIHFNRYDFFIIIAAGRFRELDAKLANEVKRLGKKFYFVRSKVDADLYTSVWLAGDPGSAKMDFWAMSKRHL